MAHHRQLIRKAVTAALLENTKAGERVYPSRILPLRALKELPAICVYTDDESADEENLSSPPPDRTLDIVIEGLVAVPPTRLDQLATADTVEDAMDDLALEIENALAVDVYFGDLVARSWLASTETVVMEDGDRPMGLVILTYRADYIAIAEEAAGALDDFLRAGVTTKVTGVVSDDDDADDLVNVRAP